tara:strand:- start:2792 stop:3823 length:1032 start_codon:yes stop_codon:yes gene_type:complete
LFADKQYKDSERHLWSSRSDVRFISLLPRTIFEGIIIIVITYIFSSSTSYIDESSQILFSLVVFAKSLPYLQAILTNYTLVSSSSNVTLRIIKNIEKNLKYRNSITTNNSIEYQSNIDTQLNDNELLSLNNISFFYQGKKEAKNNGKGREVEIINNFSYSFKIGESYFLRGNSGSGKSTLLDIISSILTPTSGEVVYKKELTSKGKFNLENLEYVSQNLYIPTMTIREYFSIGTDIVPSDEQIFEAIKLVNLEEIILSLDYGLDTLLTHNAFTLSGGQRQRLLISKMFIRQPSLLILDEGLTGIEQKLAKQILSDLSSRTNSTIITTAHDLSIVPETFKQILI